MTRERTIADLQPGESAYSLPWGLHRAAQQWWLNPNYPIAAEPVGTLRMQVKRSRDTYVAWAVNHDDFRDGEQVKVAGLAAFGGPPTREEQMAEELERLAKTFDELGEPEMAANQRRLAAQLRESPPADEAQP